MDRLKLENVRLIFRNFRGAEGKFNRAGDRSFCVVLNTQKAQELTRAGWNVRTLDPREEGGDPLHYLSVKVSYKYASPRIFMVTKRCKTKLDEDTVDTLDDVDIVSADIVINPYEWEVNGKCGVSAYLRTLYANIEEDEFADKYSFDEDDEPRDDFYDDMPF